MIKEYIDSIQEFLPEEIKEVYEIFYDAEEELRKSVSKEEADRLCGRFVKHLDLLLADSWEISRLLEQ